MVRRWQLALACLLGTLAALPLLWQGPSCGHDFDFHLQSWLAVHAAWRAGLPVPHWVAAANYGAGEPRFVFYPPLSWLLGAALGAVLPWQWVPAAFTGLCVAGAAMAMLRPAARFCTPPAAAIAATLYALSPYLLFTAYERTAYGELLAAVWMPLLLGYLLGIRPGMRLGRPLPVLRAALLIALLWYTNAPAAVMGCYMVALAVALSAATELWRGASGARGPGSAALRAAASAIARGAATLGLGCALAADYLLPAWYEQRFVAIARAVGPGMRVEDSFLFGHSGEPFHDHVLHTASLIAVATLGVAAVAAVLLLVRRNHARLPQTRLPDARLPDARLPDVLTPDARSGSRSSRAAVPLLCALVTVCALLQLRLSNRIWHLLPELAFLQFPWRLLLLASLGTALLVGLGLRARSARASRALALGAIVYAAALTGWAAETRYQPCDDEDNVPAQLALLAGGHGFAGTDEYAIANADNGEIQQGLPRVRLLASPDADEGDDSSTDANSGNPAWMPKPGMQVAGLLEVSRWEPEHVTVRLKPDANAYAVLRLQAFAAWQVLLNGRPCAGACVSREDGLLTVRLAAGRATTLDARYRTTDDVLWGRAISIAAVLLLLLALVSPWSRRATVGEQRRRVA